jgi:hypothetical protein
MHTTYLSLCFKGTSLTLFLTQTSKKLNFFIPLVSINEFKEIKTFGDYVFILQSYSYSEDNMVYKSSSIFIYKIDFDEGTADPV